MPLPWGRAPQYNLPQFPRDSIPEHRDRGVTLRQLRELREFAKRLCKAGVLRYPDDDETPFAKFCREGGVAGKRIMWIDLNQHDITGVIIKRIIPEQYSCSWAEFVAPRGTRQTRRYFVSHNWSEYFRDFMCAVEHHVFHHGVSYDDAYWICVYANNQWNVELGATLAESPFYGALHGAESTLLMLDRGGQALTRVWVIFEMDRTLFHHQNLEVGTPLGLAGTLLVSSGPFVEALKGLQSSEAIASNPVDQRMIFNMITGHDEKRGLRKMASKTACPPAAAIENVTWELDPNEGDYEGRLRNEHGQSFDALDKGVRECSRCLEGLQKCSTAVALAFFDIDEPWRRGITLAQLRAFTENLKVDMRIKGRKWEDVDWNTAKHFYVKQNTDGGRRSYVEVIASKAQAPAYFLSFRWSSTVKDVMAAIEWVAEARQFRDTVTFWVDLLALRQDNSEWDDSSHPFKSFMCTAIREGDGVIAIFGKDARLMTRAWGLFALYAAQVFTKSVDFSCVTGALATTRPFTEGRWEFGWFNPSLAHLLLKINIESAQASEEKDRCAILNAVVRRPEEQSGLSPPTTHERYDRLNAYLHRSVAGPMLRQAAALGDEHAVRDVLSIGNVNLGDDRLRGFLGQTALHVAACIGHTGVMRLLVQSLAGVDAKDLDGESPLHYAALAAQLPATRLLLEMGADAQSVSFYSETPLQVAEQRPAFFVDEAVAAQYDEVRRLLASQCTGMVGGLDASLLAVFKQHDVGQRGVIEYDVIAKAMMTLSPVLSDSEVNRLLARFSQDGQVNYEQLLKWLSA